MKKFENKTLYFVSDSNMTNPYFLEFLRSECMYSGKSVYFRNKGIPGARMDMVMNCIEEELLIETPDYVALCFGGNDLGIWLYDQALPITDELLQEKDKRVQSFVCALEENILYLRSRGIEPIFLTPICYNENIVEHSDVQTDKDSKEKTQIQDTMFTKATFRNINDIGLKALSEKGKEIAKKYNVEVWDFYAETKARVDNSHFREDGVHYNEQGHRLIANMIYEAMFGESLTGMQIPESVKALSVLEADERAYFFVKYNVIFLSYGKKEGQELLDTVQTLLREKGYVDGLNPTRVDGFLRFSVDPQGKQQEIVERIKALY